MSSNNPVWQEMATAVVTTTPETSLQAAMDLMRQRRFRHLPVVDGGRLVGILSDRDVPSVADARNVGDVMTRCVHTCGLNDRIGDVADALVAHRIGALPVVDANDRVVGIITSTDLLSYLRRTHQQGIAEPYERLVIHLDDIADVED